MRWPSYLSQRIWSSVIRIFSDSLAVLRKPITSLVSLASPCGVVDLSILFQARNCSSFRLLLVCQLFTEVRFNSDLGNGSSCLCSFMLMWCRIASSQKVLQQLPLHWQIPAIYIGYIRSSPSLALNTCHLPLHNFVATFKIPPELNFSSNKSTGRHRTLSYVKFLLQLF